MKHLTEDRLICVECMCDENSSLYKKYSEGNLRLTRCIRCGSFVDRYVEYDGVLIVLDLVLHKNPAYRHLLFNSEMFVYYCNKVLHMTVDNACFGLCFE